MQNTKTQNSETHYEFEKTYRIFKKKKIMIILTKYEFKFKKSNVNKTINKHNIMCAYIYC